jgi:hypothetical protein
VTKADHLCQSKYNLEDKWHIFGGEEMPEKIKIVLAVLLVICTFMPLGSCGGKQAATNDQTQTSSNESPAAKTEDEKGDAVGYLILIRMLDSSDPLTWWLFVVFVWPLPLLIIKRFLLKSTWKRRIGNILELLLSGYSAFVIYSLMFAFWLTPMFWGYVATLIITLYLIVHLMETFAPLFVTKARKE